MRIKQKRVQNIDGYIPRELENASVRLISPITAVPAERRSKIGAADPVEEGLRFLPSDVGPISRFNTEGRWVTRRDQPKERRFIRNVYWRWKEWRGKDYEEKEDVRSIFRDCYPRDFVEPPSEEVTVLRIDDELYFSSDSVSLPADKERLKHQINLFLELVGECELVDSQTLKAPPKVTRRSWRFLPPGRHPWDRVKQALQPVMNRMSENQAKILEIRQKIVTDLGPDEVAAGEGGFSDYLAYLFKARGLVVLESIRRDSAIYVFDQDWEQFSRLTKAEILKTNVHKARIVHATGWADRLREVVAP